MKSSEKTRRKRTQKGKLTDTFALALDVGGTFLKSAIIGSTGTLVKGSFRKVPVDSQGPRQAVVGAFVRALKPNLEIAKELGLELCGIGVGMPGPFDYDKGVSLMKHKFGAIYGLNLKNEIIQCLNLKNTFLIQFENDAGTFLRGEAWRGAAQSFDKIMGITLGTGLGSAFMIKNNIVNKGPGIPPLGVWCLPFRDGIAEDRISRRGLLTRYMELRGNERSEGVDVKDLALLGLKHGDKISLQVFKELGNNLGQVLRPILIDFEADCLVLGGQISKAYPLFSASLRKQLQCVPSLKKISRARMIDSSPLYGAANLLFQSIASRSNFLQPFSQR